MLPLTPYLGLWLLTVTSFSFGQQYQVPLPIEGERARLAGKYGFESHLARRDDDTKAWRDSLVPDSHLGSLVTGSQRTGSPLTMPNGQELYVFLDTGSSATWVAQDGLEGHDGGFTGADDPSVGRLPGGEFETGYLDGECYTGFSGKTTVTFAGMPVTDQIIGIATENCSPPERKARTSNYDGIGGLGFGDSEVFMVDKKPSMAKSLFQNWVEQRNVTNYVVRANDTEFAARMRNASNYPAVSVNTSAQGISQFWFGTRSTFIALDDTMAVADISIDNKWSVHIPKYAMSHPESAPDDTTINEQGFDAHVDTGSTLSYFPQHFVDDYYRGQPRQVSKDDGSIWIPCTLAQATPNITLWWGNNPDSGFTYWQGYKENNYVPVRADCVETKHEVPQENNCIGHVQVATDNVNILGVSFLRDHAVIFDLKPTDGSKPQIRVAPLDYSGVVLSMFSNAEPIWQGRADPESAKGPSDICSIMVELEKKPAEPLSEADRMADDAQLQGDLDELCPAVLDKRAEEEALMTALCIASWAKYDPPAEATVPESPSASPSTPPS